MKNLPPLQVFCLFIVFYTRKRGYASKNFAFLRFAVRRSLFPARRIQLHAVFAVDFFKANGNYLVFCRRNVFSDKIRANRKLRMPPVDKHRKLNPRRTTQSHYRIERSPCRSAGINNIIHKDNCFSDKRKIHFRRAYHGVGRNSRKVVAVKGYVKFADGNFCAGYPFDVFRKAERKRNAASADPDKTYAVRAVVFSII